MSDRQSSQISHYWRRIQELEAELDALRAAALDVVYDYPMASVGSALTGEPGYGSIRLLAELLGITDLSALRAAKRAADR